MVCQHCRVASEGTLERRELFGLRFISAPSERELATAILKGDSADPEARYPILVTPNVDILLHLHAAGAGFRLQRSRDSAYVLPDGQPVVWASRLLGQPLRARLAGSTLFAELWPELVSGRRVLMIASSTELVERLGGDTPTARYVVAPHLSASDTEAIATLVSDCLDVAADLKPEFVVVGLSHPKQEEIAHGLLDHWDRVGGEPPLILMLGASPEMYVGMQRRAPRWMQKVGLEWLFRFLFAPRRLFRRYFVDDPMFLLLVWNEWRNAKKHPPA